MSNLLIHGDAAACLRVHVLAGSVQLAYLDPPWRTGRAFTHYDDPEELGAWTAMMREVLIETHRALTATGSAWLHLNAAALPHSHALMDEIFGAGNFLGQVVWERRTNASYLHGQFSDTVDHILVYARNRHRTPRFTIPGSESTSRTPLLQPGNPVRTLIFPAGTVELPANLSTIPAGDHSTTAAR